MLCLSKLRSQCKFPKLLALMTNFKILHKNDLFQNLKHKHALSPKNCYTIKERKIMTHVPLYVWLPHDFYGRYSYMTYDTWLTMWNLICDRSRGSALLFWLNRADSEKPERLGLAKCQRKKINFFFAVLFLKLSEPVSLVTALTLCQRAEWTCIVGVYCVADPREKKEIS